MASQDRKTPPRPDPAKGWGEAPPLPLTAAPESTVARPSEPSERAEEIGGPKGPEPTRYNDWERKGRCSDF